MQRTGRVVHAHPHSRPPTPRPPAPSPARPACTLACTHPRPHTLVRTHERRCGHSCGRSRSLTVPPSSARVPVRSRSSPPARVRAVRARPRSRPPARVCVHPHAFVLPSPARVPVRARSRSRPPAHVRAALTRACPCPRPPSFASTRTCSCRPHLRVSLSAPALVRARVRAVRACPCPRPPLSVSTRTRSCRPHLRVSTHTHSCPLVRALV